MQKTRFSLSKIVVIVVTLAAAGMQPACTSEPPPVEDAAAREVVNSGEILFRVKVSDMGIQTGSLARGKSPDDYVEVKLPGELYNPPKQVSAIGKSQAKWDTPLDTAQSDFSATKADDDEWILENFLPEDREEIREFLGNPAIRERNKTAFEEKDSREVLGKVEYQDYTLLFIRESRDTNTMPMTFKNSPEGWKRTNALSADETLDVVFAGLMGNGEMISGDESP